MTDVRTSAEVVLSHLDLPVGTVELNDPHHHNVLSHEMRHGVTHVLRRWRELAGLRAVVVTGRGSSFCAGGDIREFPADEGAATALLEDSMRWFLGIEKYPKPVVGAINGPAIGGGLELALACDLAVAAETATFSAPELRLGVAPIYALRALPRAVPQTVAREMVLAGRVLTSEEALRYGLVGSVVAAGGVTDAARELALRVAQGTAPATLISKRLLRSARGPRPGAIIEGVARLFSDADARARIETFRSARRRSATASEAGS